MLAKLILAAAACFLVAVSASTKFNIACPLTNKQDTHPSPLEYQDSLQRLLTRLDQMYATGRADYTVRSVEELGAGEAYLPHLIGRHYEDVRVHKVGAEWTELKDKELEEESYPVRRFFTPGFKN
ncbi:acetoacetate decarboxylase [Fusarium circinatum]|uniref:Acetoacetate decarboxylase n=1 Tax=Fusarium circinatum TaxID=48490 RepID=A0A8H5U6C0_FUSCI|nr:acetoacetate decarboxylase [Fusarium circinatum]